MRRLTLFAFSALSIGVVACSSTSADTGIAPYTDLHVDPSSFQGDLPCGTASGSMRSYVAKLWDVTGQVTVDLSALTPVVVSRPTLCSQSAAFSLVEPGRFYVATIDAYDAASPCLDEASCALTAPLASTQCGFGKGPDVPPDPPLEGDLFGPPDATQSIYLRRVLIRGCKPLVRVSPGLSLDTRAVVAGVGCGTGPDEIARVRIIRDGGAPLDVLCGDPVPLTTTPGTPVSLSIFAFSSGADVPRWGTTCTGDATAGLSCAKLSEKGAVVVRGADVCAGTDGTFKARVLGVDRSVDGSCAAEASIDDLAVASYTVLVEGSGAATCKAVVQPGQRTTAACTR